MSEWKKFKLEDVCNLITDGKHGNCKDEENSGYYFLSAKDVFDGKLHYENARQITKKDFKETHRRTNLEPGDLLITNSGTIGRIAIAEEDEKTRRTTFQKSVAVLKPKRKLLLPKFFFYVTQSNQNGLIELAEGTTQQNLLLGELRKFEISFPPLAEQQKIAAVLSSLDEKIDLLHRQNRTLEALAETLFRQWFVEEAQDDWEEKSLTEVVDIGIGRTPPRKEPQWFSLSNDDVKWVSIKDLGQTGVFIFNTAEFLTEEAVNRFNIPIIPQDTILLSFKMTVGRVGITSEAMLSNEAIAHFKFNNNTPFTKEYLYFFLKNFKYDSLGSTSSIVTAINAQIIKNLLITIPDRLTIQKFKEQSDPLFEKIKQNQISIRYLETLRDLLLPKLFSGEVIAK